MAKPLLKNLSFNNNFSDFQLTALNVFITFKAVFFYLSKKNYFCFKKTI